MQIGPIPIFFADNRFGWKNRKSAGNLKNLLENKTSSGKSKFPAEHEIFRRKFKKSAGKTKNLTENKFSSGKRNLPLEKRNICWKLKKPAGK
jgi:hypothetical protein